MRNSWQKGFTLLELILTVSMLSVVALLFISYTGDVGNVSVEAAAHKIKSDIRHSQQLATTTGVTHGVQFTQNGNYVVYMNNINTPVLDPLERTQMVEDPAQFGSVNINNSYQVEFNGLGKPTVGGGGNVEVVSDSGAIRRIEVIANTGAVVVDPLDYGTGCTCRLCRGTGE